MANAPYFNLITCEHIEAVMKHLGYKYFTNGDYNLNIFAIRTNDVIANTFNDVIGVTYKVNNAWQLFKCDATTDAGLKSRTTPVNKRGTAIIVPDQYRGGWKLGLHKGKYPALVQNKPLKLYRDNDCDAELDIGGDIYEEMAGINIHHATNCQGGVSKLVDSWSAGCMVIAAKDDWDKFINLVQLSAQRYGDVFTATLLTEDQFNSVTV